MDNIIQISFKHYNEALRLIQAGYISKAKEEIEKSLKFYCKDTDILNLMGCCEYLLCDFNKAYFYWNESIKVSKINNKAMNYIDDLNGEEFKELLSIYNNSIESIKNKRYEESIILLEKVIKLDKNLIEPYYIIGLCYIELNKYNESLKYLNLVSERDKDNSKYLKCINDIKNTKLNKNTNFNSKKYKHIMVILISLIIVPSSLLVLSNKKATLEYESLVKKEEVEKQKVLVQLEEQKATIGKLNNQINVLNNIEADSSKKVFEHSLKYYKNADYEKAIEGFEYVISNSETESYIKSESIYFISVSYEKIRKYELATKYYKMYINQYPEGNYYDESLYNVGLMLFNNGEFDRAKEFLYELKSNVPDSIYINSIVESILG